MQTETLPDVDTDDSGGVGDDPLEALASLAVALDAHRLRGEALALAERVAEGRFYVACVGQFKRGKSTLLNALVGQPVLPTGVVPVTATPTIVRYGDPPSAVVRHTDGATRDVELDAVSEYVAEEANPDNAKAVEAVEVLLPSPLLRDGMCLVDTPGLGSVFEVATGSTHAFVPHIDAALLVLGADPPISADEAALAATVAGQVEHVIVVLTKADRVPAAEREQAIHFTRRVLEERIGRPVDDVFEVSSVERLQNAPTRDWDRLVDALNELSATSGRTLVRSARERAVRRLGHHLLSLAAEERRLLTAPVEEREQTLASLRQSGGVIEERLLYLGKMLLAEQERLANLFAERRQRFLAETLPRAGAELDRALDAARPARGAAFRRRTADTARDVASRFVEPWLEEQERAADELYRQAADRFLEAANHVLDELAASGVAGVSELPHALGAETAMHGRSRFYFDRFETHFVSPVPLQWLFDAIAPPGWFRRRMRRRARAFLDWLLEANTTRVRSDLLERLNESRRRLEGEIRAILEEARAWTRDAIERAEALQADGAEAVQPELDRLERITATLRTLTAGAD